MSGSLAHEQAAFRTCSVRGLAGRAAFAAALTVPPTEPRHTRDVRAHLGIFVAFLLASVASAQVSAPDPRYGGTYRFDGSEEDGRRRVRSAIEPALARMNPLMRAIAERRLDQSVPVARRIIVALNGDRISVRYEGEQSRTFESRAGHPRTVEARDGREARLTQLFRDGHLEQVFEGENGRMYNVFQLAEDGRRLTLEVVMTGERLEQPIRVQLPYVRAGG